MDSIFLRKIRVAITPRNWLLRTRLANGAVVAGYNRAGWGGRGAYIFRDEYEPELASLSYFLKPGSVFVDIGANVGIFSMKAAKDAGDSGLVIAIEPFIESARQLARNIEMNGFRNCRVRNLCISKSTGHQELYLSEKKPNSFGLIESASDTGSVSVLAVSLDDLCIWEGITRLDYLKIDAEGAEDMILEGGVASIEKFRPIIQVEVNKIVSVIPPGYRRYSKPKGINNLLIPAEQAEAIKTAVAQGFVEIAEIAAQRRAEASRGERFQPLSAAEKVLSDDIS